ncbi:MAG: hypothetical protein K2G63_07295 [Oscillospiraceae bacterium]|nr:hypothetical protein [Oscillospiraceae bacterium]
MNTEKIKSLFALFTGQNNYEEYLPIIAVSITQVEKMLKENADISDSRLDMLTASVANYRYVQIIASRMENISAYNGEMILPQKDNNALKYARQIMLDYMDICSDIINANPVLLNTGDCYD